MGSATSSDEIQQKVWNEPEKRCIFAPEKNM
jgi:hypothetical protein